jgi:hypothetical protein
MFDWLFLIFFNSPQQQHAKPTQQDFVGVVAAEAAYTALLPDKEVKPKRPIDPNCPTCRGTGKVRSGDGISWTKCPLCQAEDPASSVVPAPPGLNPAMRLQVKPLPSAAGR